MVPVEGEMTRASWRTVLFSDESRFLLSRADERIRVYICFKLRAAGRGGSVMMWAGIHHGGTTALVHMAIEVTYIK